MNIMNLNDITEKIINGNSITRQEAEFVYQYPDLDALCDAADRICRHFMPRYVDSCSIINARSGKCSEDCHWCAQSSHYSTACDTYEHIDSQEAMKAARHNRQAGIQRFSLVASGRSVKGAQLEYFANLIEKIHNETGLYMCASFGLLNDAEMQRLAKAGVKRYHCNMESCSDHFKSLCSTHTPEDKKATIEAARRAGLQVCSGGIIGMGETWQQRIEFAFELRDLDVDSVPINILNPIPGTPLENIDLISEEDIARTVATFRFILPTKSLRFAGGRLRVSPEMQRRIMRGGMNGVLMGDMLTTVSNQIDDDRKMFAETDWKF